MRHQNVRMIQKVCEEGTVIMCSVSALLWTATMIYIYSQPTVQPAFR